MGTFIDAVPDPDHPGWADDFQFCQPGDGAEPYRCHPAQFPHVTFSRPPEGTFAHQVTVVGGCQYAAVEAPWVVAKYLHAVSHLGPRNHVRAYCSPTSGAASLIYREMLRMRRHVGIAWFAEEFGRAAPMRTAWDLLCHADSVVLFEPADIIARHVVYLSQFVETRWGKGLKVVRVGARATG